MEHFLEGIDPLRHLYINPNEKSNKYKLSLMSQLVATDKINLMSNNIIHLFASVYFQVYRLTG